MPEYLALPSWQAQPTRVAAWVEQLTEHAGPVVMTRESSSVVWLEVASLRLRGYVMIEDGHAAAINFELNGLDPGPATAALLASADALGWELHEDDDEPDDDDDED